MSTPAIQPLMSLLEQAQRERDESLSAMERGRQAMQEATAQAQSLREWRSNYQARWGARFQQGGQVEIIRCYQEFMARLNQALQDQEATVEQRRMMFDQLRAQVQQREQRVGAVLQLIERRQRELNIAEQRIEQKLNDEVAARLRHNHAAGMASTMSAHPTSRLSRAHAWSNDSGQDFVNTLT